MPLSNTKAIEENSNVYLDEAKEVVPCPGDGNCILYQINLS